MVSTSARNPNESYAERAKKASTSSTSSQQKQHEQITTSHAVSALPSSLKPSQVNVWTERIKTNQMPRQCATSSPQPAHDDAIPPRSDKPDLAILDQQDEHDPFIVRVPPHLSRQSSSSTNPLPVADPSAWPHLPGADPPSHDAPSRQNSNASFRHNAYSPSGSARLHRAQSTLSQHSHSASQSRTQSRSGSSASSPRLQIRVQDDADLRLDHRSSPSLSDLPNHLRVDPIPPSADPSFHRPPPIPLQDMPPRYSQSFLPQYAFPQQFQSTHLPGHNSPTYTGQATPPYPHYPPYPAYMYAHPSLLWGDYPPPQSHNHFQSQPQIPSNHLSAPVSHKTELGSASSPVTTLSEDLPQAQNSRKPSKNVVFGTIGLSNPPTPAIPPPAAEEHQPDSVVEHVTELFSTFSIGVNPDELGPSRLGSRKSSARSLSRTVSAQEGVKDATTTHAPSREVNGIKKPVKWEFGTTLSENLDDSRPASPPTSLPPSNHRSSGPENAESVNALSSPVTSRTNHSLDKSDAGSPTSDVWVVRDYGYGFGGHSGLGNAPEVTRWEVHEREKERTRDKQREREMMIQEPPRDRNWVPGRQPGWRHENGIEDGRDGWEPRGPIDVPRHTRPRRGSLPGYGGHERGAFGPRRGRAFGGRFYGGRSRGGFFHHRPGSYPYAPQPAPPPPPPFEVLSPTIDVVNGYGQPPYIPELEAHEAIPPAPQSFVPASYLVETAQNCLLAQLEYYLSPQNMVQDFFLRQRMDHEGWIPISLLASFKRVQQLQTDVEIVREVLNRSREVEVNGGWVRMRQWEAFVLPNAPMSVVAGFDQDEGKTPGSSSYYDGDGHTGHGEVEEDHEEMDGDCDGEDCEGDDEDDDIEFVIGEEAEESWMPVPERKQ